MKRPVFLKSLTFQFTLLYVAIFAVSMAAVLGFVYQATIQDVEGQIKNVVNSQIGKVRNAIIDNGREGAIDMIDQLMEEDYDRASFFMLISPEWKVIAGNVDTWPGGSTREDQWITFIPKVQVNDKSYWVPALARTVTLQDNYLLMVGYNLWHLQKLKKGALGIFYTTMGIIFLVSSVGGYMLATIIKKRVERINLVCREVMQGDLTKRVHVTGFDDEFDMLGQNFNAMMSRIAELVDGIRTISHNVAHDLRTPLNRIRNRLEGLINESKSLPSDAIDKIKVITRDIDELVATFNAILSISEAESGAGTVNFQKFSLSNITDDVCEFYSALAEEKGIDFTFDITDKIMLNGDRHLVSQSLANLLDNAVKYTPERGKISVILATNKKDDIHGAILKIADSGSGIPEEYHEKVKQRFFRMEESRSTPGSGLGLSMVDAAMKLHGAKMELKDNNPGLLVEVTFKTVDLN